MPDFRADELRGSSLCGRQLFAPASSISGQNGGRTEPMKTALRGEKLDYPAG